MKARGQDEISPRKDIDHIQRGHDRGEVKIEQRRGGNQPPEPPPNILRIISVILKKSWPSGLGYDRDRALPFPVKFQAGFFQGRKIAMLHLSPIPTALDIRKIPAPCGQDQDRLGEIERPGFLSGRIIFCQKKSQVRTEFGLLGGWPVQELLKKSPGCRFASIYLEDIWVFEQTFQHSRRQRVNNWTERLGKQENRFPTGGSGLDGE